MDIIPERFTAGPDQWRGESPYKWSALDHMLVGGRGGWWEGEGWMVGG